MIKMTNKNPKTEYKDEIYFKPKERLKCKSADIIKWGFKFNHTTKKRRYLCKKCGFTFTVDDGFWKAKKKRAQLNFYSCPFLSPRFFPITAPIGRSRKSGTPSGGFSL